MRYKVIAFIEAEPAMGWGRVEVREAVEDAFGHYGDVSATVFVVEEPPGCDVSPVSSRACERGTKGCDTYHNQPETCDICFKAPYACRGHDKHEF